MSKHNLKAEFYPSSQVPSVPVKPSHPPFQPIIITESQEPSLASSPVQERARAPPDDAVKEGAFHMPGKCKFLHL